MEKNSDGFVYAQVRSDDPQTQRAQDLERRIRVYEELEQNGPMAGALGLGDYSAIVLLTLGLVITFYLWGY